ncbi:MAG: MinD/ParA family protein [Solirubrobacterales bacterium]
MKDQAEKLRSMAQTMKTNIEADIVQGFQHTRVIAITSGKGGVGKTNLALNLAISIATMGRRVLLLDADMGLGNVDIILGLIPKHNLYHVIKREKDVKEIIVTGPQGLKIIPGGSGVQEMANLSEHDLRRVVWDLGRLDGESDYMIIDTGAGISNNVLCFVTAADEIIVITTPEPTSMTDAYGIIKAASAREAVGRISVIVNRVSSEGEGILVGQKLKSVAQRFLGVEVEILGYVLEDRAVEEAVMKQVPFVMGSPSSPAARNVMAIARKYSDNGQFVKPNSQGLKSFFRSLAGFWK